MSTLKFKKFHDFAHFLVANIIVSVNKKPKYVLKCSDIFLIKNLCLQLLIRFL